MRQKKINLLKEVYYFFFQFYENFLMAYQLKKLILIKLNLANIITMEILKGYNTYLVEWLLYIINLYELKDS